MTIILKVFCVNMPLREVSLWADFQDNSSNKRSRFVVTGHGKYEKIPVDDGCEDTNCRSGKSFNPAPFCTKPTPQKKPTRDTKFTFSFMHFLKSHSNNKKKTQDILIKASVLTQY